MYAGFLGYLSAALVFMSYHDSFLKETFGASYVDFETAYFYFLSCDATVEILINYLIVHDRDCSNLFSDANTPQLSAIT